MKPTYTKRNLKLIICLIALSTALLLLSSMTTAQTPDFIWAKNIGAGEKENILIDGSGNYILTGPLDNFTIIKYSADALNMLWAKTITGGYAEDAENSQAGNVIVVGQFSFVINLGPNIRLTPSSLKDYFVVKYDQNGNALWAKQIGGGNDGRQAAHVFEDGYGNIIVVGGFLGTITLGSSQLISKGAYDIFIAKYDAQGNVLWAKQAGGSGYDGCANVARDASGNIFVTGWFEGQATFGSLPLKSLGDFDIFIAKYDKQGNLLWAKEAGGSGYDQGRCVGVDGSGNSFVTGCFTGASNFGSLPLTSAGNLDIFIAKYDPQGNVLWAKKAGGSDEDTGKSIAVDGSGNSVVTGYFKGTATFGTASLISAGNSDIFITKYDPQGNVLWAKQAGGSSGDGGSDLAIDGSGNIVVTGWFESTANFGTLPLTSTGSKNVFLSKLGAPLQRQVKIDPSSKQIYLNKTGSVDVVIQGVANLGSFEFEIDFNGTIARVESNSDVQLGDFLASTGRTVVPVVPSINNTAGTLVYGAASLGSQAGPNGIGILATIKWTGKAAGTTTLDLKNVKVTDINGVVIPISVMVDGEIKVKKGFWADINKDGKVDIIDVQLVCARWNTRSGNPNYDPNCDVDNEGQGDGDIDIIDVQLVASWWNKPLPSLAAGEMVAVSRMAPQGVMLRVGPAWGSDMTALAVSVESATNLGGFQFDLTSTNSVAVKSVQVGELLSQSGNTVASLGPQVSQSGHCSTMGAFSYGEHGGASGSGVLARIILDDTVAVKLENVQLVDMEGQPIVVNSIITEWGEEQSAPVSFALYQNYPNPFNAETAIRYLLPKTSQVRLRIINAVGQEIRQLMDAEQSAGSYTVQWDGKSELGQDVASGVYLYRLEAKGGGFVETKKLLLLR